MALLNIKKEILNAPKRFYAFCCQQLPVLSRIISLPFTAICGGYLIFYNVRFGKNANLVYSIELSFYVLKRPFSVTTGNEKVGSCAQQDGQPAAVHINAI